MAVTSLDGLPQKLTLQNLTLPIRLGQSLDASLQCAKTAKPSFSPNLIFFNDRATQTFAQTISLPHCSNSMLLYSRQKGRLFQAALAKILPSDGRGLRKEPYAV